MDLKKLGKRIGGGIGIVGVLAGLYVAFVVQKIHCDILSSLCPCETITEATAGAVILNIKRVKQQDRQEVIKGIYIGRCVPDGGWKGNVTGSVYPTLDSDGFHFTIIEEETNTNVIIITKERAAAKLRHNMTITIWGMILDIFVDGQELVKIEGRQFATPDL